MTDKTSHRYVHIALVVVVTVWWGLLCSLSVQAGTKWTNEAGDNAWNNPNNWDSGNVPDEKTPAVINRSGDDRAVLKKEGSAKTLRVGNAKETSGELDIAADLWVETRPRVGKEGGNGIVNQNGGSVRVSNHDLVIGAGGSATGGEWNLNDGEVIIKRGTVVVGDGSGPHGTMNLTGGVLRTRTGPLRIGANSTFRVAGSDVTDIGIGSRNDPDGSWRQSGTFHADVGPGGLTTTRVDGGGVTFKKGARLEVGFLKGSKRVGSWDVMTWDGELNGLDQLSFAKPVDTDTWDVHVVDTGGKLKPDTLRVSAIPQRRQRIASVRKLSGQVPEKAVNTLVHVLKADTPDERIDAIDTLKKMGPAAADALTSQRAVPALEVMFKLKGLQKHTVEAVTAAGVAEQVAPYLIPGLDGKDNGTRLRLIRALEMIGPDAVETAPALTELLPDPDVGQQAAEALLAIGPGALPAIDRFVDELAKQETKDPHSVRTAVFLMLNFYRELPGSADVLGGKLASALLDVLYNGEYSNPARRRVMKRMAPLEQSRNDITLVPVLLEVLEEAEDTEAFRRAVLAGAGALDASTEFIDEQAKHPYPETPDEIDRYKAFVLNKFHRNISAYPKTVRTISTLRELDAYAGKTGVHVRMKPGVYEVTLDNFTNFIQRVRPDAKGACFFKFSGSNSLFDLRGVTIKIDTRLLHRHVEALGVDANPGWPNLHAGIGDFELGRSGINEVIISGNNLIIRGLHIEDVHEIRSEKPDPEVEVSEVKASDRSFAAFMAYDENPATNWRSKADEPWLAYHFNQPTSVSSVSVQTDEGRVLPFAIQVRKTNGDGWQTVYEGKTGDDGELMSCEFDEVRTDRVRIVSRREGRKETRISQFLVGDLPWPNAYPESNRHHPYRSARTLSVGGTGNLIQEVQVTGRGSRPYGYSSIFGKGGPATLPTNKHSTVNPNNADQVFFTDFEVYARSYGHAMNWRRNNTLTFIDCYVEGELRSTDEILQETSTAAASIDFKTSYSLGEKSIQPGEVLSTIEGGMRSYNNPVPTKGDEPGVVKILSTTIKRVRSGTGLAGSYDGQVFISNSTMLENERKHYAVPSRSRIVNSSADIRYCHTLTLWKSNNIEADITVLPSPPTFGDVKRHRVSGNDIWPKPAAHISGDHHRVTLKKEGDLQLSEPKPIVIGYARGKYRDTKGVFLRNETGLPVVLTKTTRNCTVITNGEVEDHGNGNQVKRLDE